MQTSSLNGDVMASPGRVVGVQVDVIKIHCNHMQNFKNINKIRIKSFKIKEKKDTYVKTESSCQGTLQLATQLLGGFHCFWAL